MLDDVRRPQSIAGQIHYLRRMNRQLIAADGKLRVGKLHDAAAVPELDIAGSHGTVRSGEREGGGGDRRRIDRLGKRDSDRPECRAANAALGRIRGHDLRRHRVGDELDGQNVRERNVAPGVGSAKLDIHGRTAIGGDRGQCGAQIERERHFVVDDIAVDQQLDVANLDIVGNGRLNRNRRPLLHLQAWSHRFEVGGRTNDADRRGNPTAIERQIIDNLQSATAVGDKGDAASQRYCERRLR